MAHVSARTITVSSLLSSLLLLLLLCCLSSALLTVRGCCRSDSHHHTLMVTWANTRPPACTTTHAHHFVVGTQHRWLAICVCSGCFLLKTILLVVRSATSASPTTDGIVYPWFDFLVPELVRSCVRPHCVHVRACVREWVVCVLRGA